MSDVRNPNQLGHPLRSKKRRSALFIVVCVSILVHVLGLLTFGVIKIVATVVEPPPEFESIVEVPEEAPPPPPPPPTQRTTQRSMPRPQPMAAQNPLNLNVPAIQINSSDMTMGLTGRGFGGGLGDFASGSQSFRITSFGFDQMVDGTLEGQLYDLKLDPKGDKITNRDGSITDGIRDFTRNWAVKEWDRTYYKADKKLFASYFIIPLTNAEEAPTAFDVSDEVEPKAIIALYKGKFTPRESGTFRFHGRADDVLIVRLNGKIVLDGSHSKNKFSDWESEISKEESKKGVKGFNYGKRGIFGDWVTFREGSEMDLEIMIGEVPGGQFGAWLMLEEQGKKAGPQIFSTIPLTEQDKDHLRNLHPDSEQFF